jgi:hypothetical protein
MLVFGFGHMDHRACRCDLPLLALPIRPPIVARVLGDSGHPQRGFVCLATERPPVVQSPQITGDRRTVHAERHRNLRLVATAEAYLPQELDHLGQSIVGSELSDTVVATTATGATAGRAPV